MSVELHIPDLPEVPISVGAPAAAPPALPQQRLRMPWHLRVREALSSYLPLLLMLLLALATWWLVKNSPRPVAVVQDQVVSNEPDYTMDRFALERFDAAGRLKLRVEGERLRHYPVTDLVEIDEARIRAYTPDGRMTVASARRALGNGDGSEIQLWGSAEVTSADAVGPPLVMRGEFLHAFLLTERVRSHLPVVVQQGSTELRASGLEYDHATQRLELQGPMRAEMAPRGARGAARRASAP